MYSFHVCFRNYILLKYSLRDYTITCKTLVGAIKVNELSKYLCSNWFEQWCFSWKQIHYLKFRHINHDFLCLIEVLLIKWELYRRSLIFLGMKFDWDCGLISHLDHIEWLRNLDCFKKVIVNMNDHLIWEINTIVLVGWEMNSKLWMDSMDDIWWHCSDICEWVRLYLDKIWVMLIVD